MMKRLFPFMMAGVMGGLVTLGGASLLMPSQPQQTNVRPSTPYAKNVGSSSMPAPLDFEVAAEKAMPVVVHIKATQSSKASTRSSNPFFDFFGGGDAFGGPQEGSGSGVIYSSDGYIITNNHVVDFADQISVTLYDNRTFQAKLVGQDASTDLAVIKIEADGLPTLRNANSDNAKVGQWVLAVGNPFDLTSTVTAGIISAKSRDINILAGNRSVEAFIQTDAAVNPGNSGGALVDAEGRLLGINSAIATRTGSFSGYSFAIPIELVAKVVDDLIQYGETQRGLIGINIQDLDSDMASELGLDFNQGVVIMEVIDGTAGQFAGLLPDDVITKVDGKNVKSAPELMGLVGRKRPGDTVTLTISRRGDMQDIPVRLKAG